MCIIGILSWTIMFEPKEMFCKLMITILKLTSISLIDLFGFQEVRILIWKWFQQGIILKKKSCLRVHPFQHPGKLINILEDLPTVDD